MVSKRRFGQHFLKDPLLLQSLLQQSQIDHETAVLEIGPGQGTLTEYLLKKARHVLAVELDIDLFHYLNEKFREYKKLTLYQGNVLRGSQQINPEIAQAFMAIRAKKHHVVSSPPYYCISSLISSLLITPWTVDYILLVVPEVTALRLVAQPGDSEYGTLSIIAQLFSKIQILQYLPKRLFHPAPKIDSRLISLTPTNIPITLPTTPWSQTTSLSSPKIYPKALGLPSAPSPLVGEGWGEGFPPFANSYSLGIVSFKQDILSFAHQLFSHRRKKLFSSLKLFGYKHDEIMASTNRLSIPAEKRIDHLSPFQILSLYKILAQKYNP